MESTEKGNFDQGLEYKAHKCWSKYTKNRDGDRQRGRLRTRHKFKIQSINLFAIFHQLDSLVIITVTVGSPSSPRSKMTAFTCRRDGDALNTTPLQDGLLRVPRVDPAWHSLILSPLVMSSLLWLCVLLEQNSALGTDRWDCLELSFPGLAKGTLPCLNSTLELLQCDGL